MSKSIPLCTRLRYSRARFCAKVEAFRENSKVRKFSDFCYTPYFVYAVGLTVLVLNFIGIDALTYAFLALTASAVFIFCPDVLPVFTTWIFCTVARSLRGRFSSDMRVTAWGTGTYAVIGVCIGIAALCALFHIATSFSLDRVRGSRLLGGFVALSAALICNGFFCKYYVLDNLLKGLSRILYICGAYVAARALVRPTRDSVRYFAYISLVHGLVVSIMLCEAYFFNKQFVESGYSKDMLFIGFGVSNTIGEALFRSIPLCFYLMCTEEKHCWYYFVAATLMFAAQVFTYARASILVTLPIFVLCYALCCVFGKNRKQTVVCGLATVLIVVAALLSVREKLAEMMDFFVENGMSDRGRFELWNVATEDFLNYPVFGAGFDMNTVLDRFNKYTHNTLLQIAGSCGTVGLCAYFYHRAQTVNMYFRRPTVKRTFLGILVAGILLISLLDCFYFKSVTHTFLGLALALSERDLESKELPLGGVYRRA